MNYDEKLKDWKCSNYLGYQKKGEEVIWLHPEKISTWEMGSPVK